MSKSENIAVKLRLPGAQAFQPPGTSPLRSGRISISLQEFQTLALVDFDSVDIQRAAIALEISLDRFSLILDSARRKISAALVDGRTIVIEASEDRRGSSRCKCGTCGNVWTEKEPIDIEEVECPRCGGSRIIDLSHSVEQRRSGNR